MAETIKKGRRKGCYTSRRGTRGTCPIQYRRKRKGGYKVHQAPEGKCQRQSSGRKQRRRRGEERRGGGKISKPRKLENFSQRFGNK